MALTDKLTNIADAIREKTGSTRTMNLEGMAAAVTNIKIPTALSDLNEDETHRTVTDAEKKTWNNKSDFSGNYDDLENKPTIPTIPEKLPNPNALTFTGAVTGSYDGSEPLTVEIPSGEDGTWELINTITIGEDNPISITFSTDSNGNPFALKKLFCIIQNMEGNPTYIDWTITGSNATKTVRLGVINQAISEAKPLKFLVEIEGDFMKSYLTGSAGDYYRFSNDFVNGLAFCKKLSFKWGTNTPFNNGVVVSLYGVRK